MKDSAYELERERVEIAGSALAPPILSWDVEKEVWRLEADYAYDDDGTHIAIASGFEFDLASVPRPFWWLIAPFELSVAAPLLHDFLYVHRGRPPEGSVSPPRTYTRLEADRLFRRVMEREGVPAWRRALAYRAVRWFGSFPG